MNELIAITTNETGQQLISAKELYEFLESKRDFTTWVKNRIEKYEFQENIDFTLHKFVVGKNWAHDYIITLDMAKELSMVENNEKGRQARKYFIEVEKKFKNMTPVLLTAKELTISPPGILKFLDVMIEKGIKKPSDKERIINQLFRELQKIA